MVCSRLLEALRQDKHEIFRAARDAHKAADLLIALELEPSFEKALASVNAQQTGAEIEGQSVRPSEQQRPRRSVAFQTRSKAAEMSHF
jgi:hypothetical protein